jgi:hypothetical protein
MPADSPQIAGRSNVARSRVTTNDSRLLAGVDGRSTIARRYRDVMEAIISDLGGEEVIGEGQRQLARRAAALSVQCEQIEANMATGGHVDANDYVRLVNALNRTLKTIGLKRQMKDVTPTGIRAKMGLE